MIDRVRRLLEAGYLPSQLPPTFTTRQLAADHATYYQAWLALQKKSKKGQPFVPKAEPGKPEAFSVARVGHQRRVTSIPNPVTQTYLATHVAAHWGSFVKHYRQSRLSASHQRFLHKGARAASIPSMQMLYVEKVARSAGYRYMLRTDVSRFFPTIYTHSVPWAFHGKAASKGDKDPAGANFGNLLDLALRQGQDGQTIGLPIGPDTSHLIAEAIATAIDVELRDRLGAWPSGFRYVDDYFLFFATENEAEEALAALVRVLKQYELQINFEKTRTCQVIEITDDYWTHQLRNFEIGSGKRRQTSDVNHFFELAKDLARKNADESVMVYALKRLSSTVIRKESWDAFEAHLCHVALAYSNTLQAVARLLSTYADLAYPLNRPRIARLINAVIEDHAPLDHHSEVAWCLWMCKALDLQLHVQNIDRVADMHSSVCALLLLDVAQAGKLVQPPNLTYWKSFENSPALHGELWLLSYEAGVRGWAGFSAAHVKANRYFQVLHQANVHFYDPTAKLPPVFQVKSMAMKAHHVQTAADLFDLDEIDDFDALVDYEEGDGGYEGVVMPDSEVVGSPVAGIDDDEDLEGFFG